MANVKISDLTPATSVGSSDLIEIVQSGASKSATPAMIATFLQGQFVQVLSRQNGGDTNTASVTATAYFDHNLSFSVPANFLTTNKILRITAQWKFNTGSAPANINMRMRAGSTTLVECDPNAVAANMTNNQVTVVFEIHALAAPSASSAVDAGVIAPAHSAVNTAMQNTVDTPVNLATNGAISLTVGTRWAGAGTGVNTAQLTRLVVEAL